MFKVQDVLDWINASIESKSYQKFADLHLCDITDAYRSQSNWLVALKDVSIALRDHRHQIPPRYCVSIAVSLKSREHPMGVRTKDIIELAKEFTIVPPSLYVFDEIETPWKMQPDKAEMLPSSFLPWDDSGSIRAVHFEYREEFEVEFRRSLWILV